jgi:mono/diheme cytochrome c family protein
MCLLLLGLAACGGHRTHTSASRIDQGAALFKSTCTACHTLDASGRASGGDLALSVLPVSDLVSFERIMPVKLTPAQLYDVALYLHAIEASAKAETRP